MLDIWIVVLQYVSLRYLYYSITRCLISGLQCYRMLNIQDNMQFCERFHILKKNRYLGYSITVCYMQISGLQYYSVLDICKTMIKIQNARCILIKLYDFNVPQCVSCLDDRISECQISYDSTCIAIWMILLSQCFRCRDDAHCFAVSYISKGQYYRMLISG